MLRAFSKKEVLFIQLISVVLLGVLYFFSCQKDEGIETRPLQLSASANEIFVGDDVKFSVEFNGKKIDALIYIGDDLILQSHHTFLESGTYKVVAKKSGFMDSNPVVITVKEKPRILLEVPSVQIAKGDKVTFTVTSGGNSIEADIYINGQKITGNTYTFAQTGTFTAVAKKEGYLDSPELKVTVSEKPSLQIAASATQVTKGDKVTFTVTSGGNSISADIYINGQKITGNTYTFAQTGTFTAVAKKEGYLDSPELKVTVSEKPSLQIAASATQVTKGDKVSFTVTSGGNSISADIYINGQKITGNTYTFAQTGTFTAVAKKEGYLDSPDLPIVVSEPVYQSDVYVAGYGLVGVDYVAKYWKNGSATNITSTGKDHIANSIFVAGDNVYIVGHEVKTDNTKSAKYWLNGREQFFSSGSFESDANSVFVYNNDVYIAGFQRSGVNTVAMYWKNGNPVPLTNGTSNAEAHSVFVYKGDVYVAGFENNGNIDVAKYWKNGVATTLSASGREGVAYSIAVENNDVYVAGRESNGAYDVATYWKNGSKVSLTAGNNADGVAYSIFPYEGVAYTAGLDRAGGFVAKYWRNSATNILNGGSLALSIFVSEGDVYVSGYENNGSVFIAKYWKNGTPHVLSDSRNFASGNSIFVYKKRIN